MVMQAGSAFSAMTRDRADALIAFSDPSIVFYGKRISDLAAKSRLLLSGGLPEGVDEQDVTQDKMRSRFDEILESFNQAMGERNATLDELRRDAEDNG